MKNTKQTPERKHRVETTVDDSLYAFLDNDAKRRGITLDELVELILAESVNGKGSR